MDVETHTQTELCEKAGRQQQIKPVITNHASSFLTHSWVTEEKQTKQILVWLHNYHFSQSSIIKQLQRSGTQTRFSEKDPR